MAAMRLSSSMALTHLLPLLLLAATSIPTMALASPALDHSLDSEGLLMLGRFHRWMTAHGRSYATMEEKLHRFGIYRSNMESVKAANKDGRMSYKLGETAFTDLTHEEFRAMYVSGGLSSPEPEGEMITTRALPPTTIEEDDGGRHASKASNGLRYDMGCLGGLLGNAFRWVIENGGITWASRYPYIGWWTGQCRRVNPIVRLRGYQFVQSDEVSLMQAVAQQPVAVSINFDDPCLQHYRSGVYDGSCFWSGVYVSRACKMVPNHAIAIIGYGAKPDGTKYWIAKNSYGQGWGDNGFIYLHRRSPTTGLCALATSACYPINL